jgi:hypothetical protein
MKEQQPSEKIQPAPDAHSAVVAPSPAASPPAASSLSPEEQMALFEKELKENDWGHQPC